MSVLEFQVASGALLDVRRFVVREAVSEPFNVAIVARSSDPSLDLDLIVGHPASFRIVTGMVGAQHPERRWIGICRFAELERVEPAGLSTYRFDLVPALWALTQRRDHRIILHRSAPDIAAGLLDLWSIEHALAVEPEAHPKLPYKVQYGESDYAFFCRILEEAGIAFTFPEGREGHGVITLADRLHAGAPRSAPIAYEPSPNEAAEREFITDVRLEGEVRPGAYIIRDYDLRKPDLLLAGEAEKAPAPEARLEQYHYRPGAFLADTTSSGKTPVADDEGPARHDPGEGRRRAQRALESVRADRRVVAYRTNVLDLWPGRIIMMTGHPHPELDASRRLLVTELTIEGAPGEAWTTAGRAVFADLPYHPPLRTPRPRARIQSATVVSPSGEDVHTDEFGRVRVRFPWDRGAGHSCWIRVSQAWAGAGYGMMALPRLGQEVLVDFLEGDPEQPVIVGRVFNRTNPVIERLPEHETKSIWKSNSSPAGGGLNEILFEDRKGSELFYDQAERDARRLVKHDDTATVVHDRRKDVAHREIETTDGNRVQETRGDRIELTGRDRTTAIEGTRRDRVSRESVERIEAERQVRVGKDRHVITKAVRRELVEHDEHRRVDRGRHESVGGTDSLTVGEHFDESVGSYVVNASGPEGTIHLVAGSAIVIESAADVTVKASGNFVKADGGGVTIVGTEVVINEGGSPGSLPGPGSKLPERPREAEIVEPPPPPPPKSPDEQNGSYEIVVVDELEAPVSGLEIVITTPAGTTTETTDENGHIRVEPAPPEKANAWVKNPADVARHMAGKERGPRRTKPLPEGDPWHVRTPTDLGQTIVLPEGKPQKLMIVTRTNLSHHAASSPWAGHTLAEGGPVVLEKGDPVLLQMSSDATAAEAVVVGERTKPGGASGTEPSTRSEAAPGETREWLRATVDSLHDGLFKAAFDTVFQILESIPLDPPRQPPEPLPEPEAERKAFEEALSELSRDGVVDPTDTKDIGQA
ncbi:MAG: type VI secretion system tip protein TssI/VgrG [Minicystis sp.]